MVGLVIFLIKVNHSFFGFRFSMRACSSLLCTFLLLFAICSFFSAAAGQTHRGKSSESMTDKELTEEAELEKIRAINKALRQPDPSEKRVIGNLQKIDCKKGIAFTVKTDSETFALASKDFDSLVLNAFVPMAGNSSVGCELDVSMAQALITYKERPVLDGKIRGDLVSIEFVPPGFRIMSQDEMNKSFAIDPSAQVLDGKEQEAIVRGIRRALYQPKEGETRKLGYLAKIECKNNGRNFVINVVAKSYRLFSPSPDAVPIRLFTRELQGMQFGCLMDPIDVPVVFIYKENSDLKTGSDGELVSLDFVPRGFTLD